MKKTAGKPTPEQREPAPVRPGRIRYGRRYESRNGSGGEKDGERRKSVRRSPREKARGTLVRRKTGAAERLLAGLGVLAAALMLILPLASTNASANASSNASANAENGAAGRGEAVPVMALSAARDELRPPSMPASFGEDRSVFDALGEFIVKLIYG
ncbi:MAG: hypothetical protein IKQ92_05300 [Clostridia bacterium]|nr:hypothetical protein [Clostridia bacterium]